MAGYRERIKRIRAKKATSQALDGYQPPKYHSQNQIERELSRKKYRLAYWLLYEASHTTFKNLKISIYDVDDWTKQIARNCFPVTDEFTNIAEFRAFILCRIRNLFTRRQLVRILEDTKYQKRWSEKK